MNLVHFNSQWCLGILRENMENELEPVVYVRIQFDPRRFVATSSFSIFVSSHVDIFIWCYKRPWHECHMVVNRMLVENGGYRYWVRRV